MPKQLLLIRHGKSDWGNSHLADFDRPLNSRGLRNAPEMATRLSNKHFIPELIVSSPAMRALTTARNFAQVWNKPLDQIKEEPSIYEANTTALLSIVNKLDDHFNMVAMFGHNPGFTEFANYLSDSNIHNIPTCGVVIIEFPFEKWNHVSADTGALKLFDYPKSIEED
ncbi:histidine phosphatase family protein [Pedobacter sp. MC2016-14]|uniref:SixA phosphatase family protein n=1 Tax=Pedobacter sp. MC2016-14 TaxID=2897327 RepID=UPI001E58DE1D|nr:histidine phosphatase family protein [Pedobacter sp. MC2016-14]MCD0488757.1 histidine phosphatase family protein [Pedobacter sp. MC2016-14]